MSLGGATTVFEAFMATVDGGARSRLPLRATRDRPRHHPDGVEYTYAQTRAEVVTRIRVRQYHYHCLPSSDEARCLVRRFFQSHLH